jgi:predicted O-methyltransferase YrrM
MHARYDFTTDWFTAAQPSWHRLLDPLAGVPGLRFIEVGVFEGRSTVWLLDHVLTARTARLDCVDPFVWPMSAGRPASVRMRDVKRRFHRNVAASGASSKVRLIEGRSDTALAGLPPDSYDCVYVDGSHRADDVLSDAVLSFRLLKPGGLLIFDDYGMVDGARRARSLDVPRRGIDAFLAVFAERLDVVLLGYQVAARKRVTGRHRSGDAQPH